jgi:prevent-host-death family protein
MKTLSVSQLKAHLSEELERVQAGGEVIVTDRGRPVARIVPMPVRSDRDLDALVRAGLVRPGDGLPEGFWALSRPDDPLGGTSAALADERGEGW